MRVTGIRPQYHALAACPLGLLEIPGSLQNYRQDRISVAALRIRLDSSPHAFLSVWLMVGLHVVKFPFGKPLQRGGNRGPTFTQTSPLFSRELGVEFAQNLPC